LSYKLWCKKPRKNSYIQITNTTLFFDYLRMKKKWLFMIGLGIAGLLVAGFTSASGCFWDPLYDANDAAYIKSAVNVRTVPCMNGSTVQRVAAAGEKIRIIAKDPARWYKIVLNDGTIGWIAVDFASTTNDRTWVPEYPTNHIAKSYCDVNNPSKCPAKPVAPGIDPERTYGNTVPTNTQTPPPTTTPTPQPTQFTLTESEKKVLDSLWEKYLEKLENKYPKLNDQLDQLEDIIVKLELFEKKSSKIALFATHLKLILQDALDLKQMSALFELD